MPEEGPLVEAIRTENPNSLIGPPTRPPHTAGARARFPTLAISVLGHHPLAITPWVR